MKQLTDLREKGRIAYFETRGRELVLYWRELAPKQKIELTVDLVCDVPGEYRGPASRGYLYYDADHKHWVEPLAVKIAAHGEREGRRSGRCEVASRTLGSFAGRRRCGTNRSAATGELFSGLFARTARRDQRASAGSAGFST